VVAVDMGYGHQRAALPFKDIAQGGQIITANNYPGIAQGDRKIWEDTQRLYETISRFKKFPILGDFVFSLFDKFQEIKEFYPSTQSIDSPTMQLKQIYRIMENKKWGRNLIWKLNRKPLPLITTFFTPAYMAEFWGYKGPIYLVIPDTDISRAWAPLKPSQSKIIYCASTQRAADRLQRYGVREKNVVVTGFPLPGEFTRASAFLAKRDLKRRLVVLDPEGKYRARYEKLVEQYVGKLPSEKAKQPVNLTFAIGGAGAQVEIAKDMAESVAPLLKSGKLRLHLVAGIHRELAADLRKKLKARSIVIHSSPSKKKYFADFARLLSQTDILWTKPSELVFYAGLGIPIIIAPPIGSQEVLNRKWLLDIGAGLDQKKPSLVHQWLPDLIREGNFAEAAMQGFVEIEKNGTENIKKLVCGL